MPEPSANCNERRAAEAARVVERRLDLLRFAASSVDSGVHTDTVARRGLLHNQIKAGVAGGIQNARAPLAWHAN